MYIYIFIYICMYVCMYIYTHTYIYRSHRADCSLGEGRKEPRLGLYTILLLPVSYGV